MNTDQFLRQHLDRTYRFALRLSNGDVHLAEDLTQEAMMRVWKHRADLTNENVARVWLFQTVKRLRVDDVRRTNVRKRHTSQLADFASRKQMHSLNSATNAEDMELAMAALRLLDDLPPRQRDVLYLRICEDMEITTIARILDISPSAVTSSLSIARRTIADRWNTLNSALTGSPNS